MKSGFHILLVEDNIADARLVTDLMRENSSALRIDVAKDGTEAMSYLNQQQGFAGAPRPDLIILDLNLPAKSGREVLEEIKSDPALRQIPVIIFTTSGAEEDIFKSYDLFANCYLRKPVDLEKFMAVIKAIKDFWIETAELPSTR